MDENEDQLGKGRLRPWLEGLLESGNIPDLRWLDKKAKKFMIPWYHLSRPRWTHEKGQIFKEWAVQTGRFREGVDTEDWVQWKTRLRCALNKAPDIKEIKEESKERPDEPQPYRVYKFMARAATKTKKPVAASRNVHVPDAAPGSQSAVVPEAAVVVNAMLPTVLQDHEDHSEAASCWLPPDLIGVQCRTNGWDEDQLNDAVKNMSISLDGMDQYIESAKSDPAALCVEEYDMIVRLFYCNKEVVTKVVNNKSGVRLHYGESLKYEQTPPELLARMYTDEKERPDSMWLPPCTDLMINKKVESQAQQVLETGMEGGIYLRMSKGSIKASRFCKCSIFYASNASTDGNPLKLPRDREVVRGADVETTVFDYARFFHPAVERYNKGHGPLPDPNVYVMFGCARKITELNENVPIYAQVTSVQAERECRSASECGVNLATNEVQDMSLGSMKIQDFECPAQRSVPGLLDMDDELRNLVRELVSNNLELASSAATCANLPQFVEDENSAISSVYTTPEHAQDGSDIDRQLTYLFAEAKPEMGHGGEGCGEGYQSAPEHAYIDASCHTTPTYAYGNTDYGVGEGQVWCPSGVDNGQEFPLFPSDVNQQWLPPAGVEGQQLQFSGVQEWPQSSVGVFDPNDFLAFADLVDCEGDTFLNSSELSEFLLAPDHNTP